MFPDFLCLPAPFIPKAGGFPQSLCPAGGLCFPGLPIPFLLPGFQFRQTLLFLLICFQQTVVFPNSFQKLFQFSLTPAVFPAFFLK